MTRKIYQAEISKAEADANIRLKINILSSWLAHGIPYLQTLDGSTLLDSRNRKQLDFFPKSLRQFKTWDGSQNCEVVRAQLPAFTATGNDTLAKRPELANQARQAVEALRKRAEAQNNESRLSEIQNLTVELRIARATIEIRNAELRAQQRTIRTLERTKLTLDKKITGDGAEFHRIHSSLLVEIENLRSTNAQLAAQLAKLAPLRRTSDV